MRVCFITGEYPPMQGGVGDYTAVLAQTLQRMGADAGVVTSTAAAGKDTYGEVSVFPEVRKWGWRSLGTVARIARDWNADILHLQYQAAPYGLGLPIHFLMRYLQAFAPRVRRVTTFHDLRLPYLFPKAGRARPWAIAQLMAHSDATIVTNREDEIGIRNFRAQLQPHLIPIGSNIQPHLPRGFERTAWRARRGFAPSDIVLAYFGFLNATKGGDTLIAAVGELARRGRPVKLLMIGGKVGASDVTNQQFAQHVEGRIQQEGVADRVVWTGYVAPEEVSAAFAVCDMTVLPYSDGVSFRRGSLMAALAHGIPVITTVPQIDLPELIPEENVILVAPEHPGEIVEAVIRVADHEGLRTRLAEGARRLSDRFSWERIGKETLSLYERLLKTESRP